MSILVKFNYVFSFLVPVIGIVAYLSPAWLQVVESGFTANVGIILSTVPSESSGNVVALNGFTKRTFFGIQTAIVLFPLALAIAIAGLVRFIQGQKYQKANTLGQRFIQKVQQQALMLHAVAGFVLLATLAFYTTFLFHGTKSIYFPGRGRAFPPSKLSFGYAFYLGWITLLLQLIVVVFNAVLLEKLCNPSTPDVINMS